MTMSVIVHVEADRAYVDSLQDALESARLVACVLKPRAPLMAFDARLPLMLVWSRQAEERRAGPAFAAMARLHRGQTIICVIDDCPAPASLQKLQAAVVNGSPRSSMFPNGLNAALREAQRRQAQATAQAAQQRDVREAASRRAFAEGMTRGLAGSAALFGIGGAAALAVEQFTGSDHATMADAAPHVEMVGSTYAPQDDAGMDRMDGAVFAEAEVIYVAAEDEPAPAARADLRDVPLATTPTAELAAARRTLGFTEAPVEVWMPDPATLEGLTALNAPFLDEAGADDMQETGWRPVERVIIHPDSPDATLIIEEPANDASDPAV